ncbi:MAG: hypothetical protein ABJN22_00775 [Litorimonas sp.]
MSLFRKFLGKSKRTDFAEIIHDEMAQELLRSGQLVAVHPFPVEFGGVEGPLNTAYIPPQALEKFEVIIDRLRHLGESGEIDRLKIDQDYRGASIIPTRIYFIGSLGDEDQLYNLKMDIW